MSKNINLKAIFVVSFSMLLGGYLIIFQDQIITGLAIVSGGVSLSFPEVMKWIKYLINLYKSFNNESSVKQEQDDLPNTQHIIAKDKAKVKTVYNRQNIINFGNNNQFKGDVAMGESKIDKK